jgi:hypothetical protein
MKKFSSESYRCISYVDTYAVVTLHSFLTKLFLNNPKFHPVYVVYKTKKTPIMGFFYTYDIPANSLEEFKEKIKCFIKNLY